MKKILVRGLVALVVVVLLVVVCIGFFLDGAVKRGVETVGPMLAKVEVKLNSVNLSLLSGSGKIKGLLVGNPEGYKTPSSIQVGTASLALQPSSIFSDKVIVKSIRVDAPEITFETDLKGNNLSKILANLQAATGSADNAPSTPTPADKSKQAKAGKKLQVDDFLITGGRIHVTLTTLGTQSATVPLPEIHLAALGQGPEGITTAELAKRVIEAIEKEAIKASSATVADLAKNATALTKAIGTNATGTVDKISQGLGGLLKKK